MEASVVRGIQIEKEGALSSAEDDAQDLVLRLAAREIDRAYRLAGLILGSELEAEDATQDAVIRAWRSARSLRDPEKFNAWFDRIVVNTCIDRSRRRRRLQQIHIDEVSASVPSADPFVSLVLRDEVLSAMRYLDVDERAIVVLHYWADLTLDGVAMRLGRPVGTVKSKLNRALGKLRQELPTRGHGVEVEK
jgi:RNA polymerase sigma-70 factor (ECF subfamily)